MQIAHYRNPHRVTRCRTTDIYWGSPSISVLPIRPYLTNDSLLNYVFCTSWTPDMEILSRCFGLSPSYYVWVSVMCNLHQFFWLAFLWGVGKIKLMQIQTIESNAVPNHRHLLRIPIVLPVSPIKRKTIRTKFEWSRVKFFLKVIQNKDYFL